MCLNGWGGRLDERLIPYPREVSPDTLCLQEVVAALLRQAPTSNRWSSATPHYTKSGRFADYMLDQRPPV
jgi:hypothetical protein